MDSPINEIKVAFYKASKSRDTKLLQDIFYFYIDRSASYPQEALELLEEILATKQLFTKKGINKFFIENIIFLYKLSNVQKEKLLNAICTHYSQYENSSFCETLCETISDMYGTVKAVEIFSQLYLPASTDGKNGIILHCDSLIYRSDSKNTIATTMARIREFIPNYQHFSEKL